VKRAPGRAALALVLLLGAACSDERAPAPAPVAPKPVAPAKSVATVARAERLARDRAALEARLPALDAAPRGEEFLAAVRALADEPSLKRFVKLGADDWLPKAAARSWLEWNCATPGATSPAAQDVTRDGHPWATLLDLEAQLAKAGVHLLFVPVPSRLQLEPELVLPALAGAGPPVARVAATTRFLAQLAAAGVESHDLAPGFMAQRDDPDPRRARLWLRGNNHWSPRAAEQAAREIAERLATWEELAPGPLREGVDFTVARALVPVTGDGLGQAEGAPAETIAMNGLQWQTAAPTAAVARGSPIVLLGDSFAAMFKEQRASFVDQLVRFTGWPIDAITPQGGAELACRESLSRRESPLAGKKVVIWLVPESLLVPSGLWKKVAIGGG